MRSHATGPMWLPCDWFPRPSCSSPVRGSTACWLLETLQSTLSTYATGPMWLPYDSSASEAEEEKMSSGFGSTLIGTPKSMPLPSSARMLYMPSSFNCSCVSSSYNSFSCLLQTAGSVMLACRPPSPLPTSIDSSFQLFACCSWLCLTGLNCF
eukprot:jgi/Botrbrau1/20521/Bobra.145_2s0074.1